MNKGQKIVFTAGVFDLLHKGHLNLFKEMRKEAGELGKVIVILHDDKSTFENKGQFPVQDTQHRYNNLCLLEKIDAVEFCNLCDPVFEFMNIIRNNKDSELIFMRGDDKWNGGDAPGIDYLKKHNIIIKYISYTKGISSTLLRENLK